MNTYDSFEGIDFSQLNTWGMVYDERSKRFVNFYQDYVIQYNIFGQPILDYLTTIQSSDFEILDAGGGDGVLTQIMIQILLDDKYTDFQITNIDCSHILKSAEANRVDAPIEIRNRWRNLSDDLTRMKDVHCDHFDAIISRMSIQYSAGHLAAPKARTQQQYMKEMFRVLKPGGLMVMVYPGSRSFLEYLALQLINSEIMAKIGAGNGVTVQKRFENNLQSRAYSEIEFISELAITTGFNILECRELAEYKFAISAEAYWDRFGRKYGASLEDVQQFTEEAEAKYENLFVPLGLKLERHPITKALVYPSIYFILQKPQKGA